MVAAADAFLADGSRLIALDTSNTGGNEKNDAELVMCSPYPQEKFQRNGTGLSREDEMEAAIAYLRY